MTVLNIAMKPLHSYRGTKILDGNNYSMTFRWTIALSKWYLDLEGISNNIKIPNIALLPGIDLFKKSGYAELGELRMVDNSGAMENPDLENVNGRFTLEYTTIGE